MEDLKKKYPKEFECYERYKKLNGYNYCEGLEDVFGLMAAFAQEQLFDLADVVGQSEQLICAECNKYKRTQGNGIMHKLCECGE